MPTENNEDEIWKRFAELDAEIKEILEKLKEHKNLFDRMYNQTCIEEDDGK